MFFVKIFMVFFISLIFFQPPVIAMNDVRDDTDPHPHPHPHPYQKHVNAVVCLTVPPIFEKFNRNGAYPGRGIPPRTLSKLWLLKQIKYKATVLGEKKELNFKTLILNTHPQNIIEAIEDLEENPGALECTLVSNVAKLCCMKNIMGKKNFRSYAMTVYEGLKNKLGFSTDDFFLNLSNQFTRKVMGPPTAGTMFYIANIPEYLIFKLYGPGQGANVFYLGDNQHLGFNPAIYKNGSQPLNVLVQQDFELFSDPTDVEEKHLEHATLRSYFQEHRGEFQERHRAAQKNYDFHFIFDVQKFIEFEKTRHVLFQKII